MRIMFVGDICLGEYYTSFGHGPGTFLNKRDVFSEVKGIFSQADIVVGNLEASLTTCNIDKKEPERMVLRGNPAHANVLKAAGFNVLQVANNHTVQHGIEGFNESIDALNKEGISVIGLNNQKVTILTINNKKVGFFAASDVPDNTDKNQTSYQALSSDFLLEVKAAVSEVDYLFVLFHWGLEASTIPLKYQRELTTELINAGVKGVIGSHPHLFYEVWLEKEAVAAPSLGNFVFDLGWDKRLLQSGILDVEINGSDMKVKVWPVELKENGCLPTPTADPINVESRVTLYDNGMDMKGEEIRKLTYFFKNIFKGNLILKLKFIARKFFPFLKPKHALSYSND